MVVQNVASVGSSRVHALAADPCGRRSRSVCVRTRQVQQQRACGLRARTPQHYNGSLPRQGTPQQRGTEQPRSCR